MEKRIPGEKTTPEEMLQEIEGTEEGHDENENAKREQEGLGGTEEGQTQGGISEEEWIVHEVDQKENIRSKIETELKLLENAAKLAVQIDRENEEKQGTELEEKEASRAAEGNIIIPEWQNASFWTNLLLTGRWTSISPREWMKCWRNTCDKDGILLISKAWSSCDEEDR